MSAAGEPNDLAYLQRMFVTRDQFGRDTGQRCIHCVWVEVLPQGSLACLNAGGSYGQAKRHGCCCRWEREPGSDDELS